MGGLAVVFVILWLRHNKAWAKIVAIILGGIYLLYTAMRPKTS
jgi:hypothetical protein